MFINVYIYDVSNAKLIIKKNKNNYVKEIYANHNDSQRIINGKYLKLDKQKIKYKILNEKYFIDSENIINYKIFRVKIDIPKKYLHDNIILNVKIFSNKERMINKIIKLFK